MNNDTLNKLVENKVIKSYKLESDGNVYTSFMRTYLTIYFNDGSELTISPDDYCDLNIW